MVLGPLFGWLRGSSTPAPLPDALWQDTLSALPFLQSLNADERGRLRALSEAFLAEKEFSSAGGLELDDAMCVAIAVQACLPILELGLGQYRDWVGIIVYPDEFVIPRRIEDEDGLVHEYDEVAAGEAWDGGPVLISWVDTQMAGAGYNVVIHEFAHKLDMRSGVADGVPSLPPGVTREQWEETMFAAYDDFCAAVDDAEERAEAGDEAALDELPFDPYAAENPAEFFAVMSEAFFETPEVLRDAYPDFYDLLRRYYRQDPAARLSP